MRLYRCRRVCQSHDLFFIIDVPFVLRDDQIQLLVLHFPARVSMFFLPLRSLPISHLSIDTDAIIQPIRNSPTQAFCVASVLERLSSQSSTIHILNSTRTQLVLTQDLHLHYNRLRNCATIQLLNPDKSAVMSKILGITPDAQHFYTPN